MGIKKIGKAVKEVAKGTLKNMKAGFMSNFDPNQKGGLSNFAKQSKQLYGKKK